MVCFVVVAVCVVGAVQVRWFSRGEGPCGRADLVASPFIARGQWVRRCCRSLCELNGLGGLIPLTRVFRRVCFASFSPGPFRQLLSRMGSVGFVSCLTPFTRVFRWVHFASCLIQAVSVEFVSCSAPFIRVFAGSISPVVFAGSMSPVFFAESGRFGGVGYVVAESVGARWVGGGCSHSGCSKRSALPSGSRAGCLEAGS